MTPDPTNAPASPASAALVSERSPASALDAACLLRLRELDPEGRHGVLARVLTAYETSLVRMLAQLDAQRGQGDAAAVAHLAHTLKSSSASVGALGLAAACARVESAIRNGGPVDLQADVPQLLAEGQAALQAVRAMLQARDPS